MRISLVLSRHWLATTLLVIAGGVVCARLGIWQLDRLAERRAFNQHVTLMRALPALELPSAEDLQTQEFRAVQVRGAYDFQHQVVIRNQAYEGQIGYHLLTPLLVEGSANPASADGAAILVDRGWIPAEGNGAREDWRRYDAVGTMVVHGLIRLGQHGPALGGLAQPTGVPGQAIADDWLYIDVAQISRELPYSVLPVYLQLDSPQGSVEAPIPVLPTLDLSEGPHLGYAIQWFGFAAVLIIGYPLYVNKQEAGNK